MKEINYKRLQLAIGLLLLLAGPSLPPPAAAQEAGLQSRFELALEALENDRLNTARRLLNALLADEPTLHRARLELARANYLAADFAGARREAERVLAEPELPASVRTTVLAFLAQIREDERRFAQRHRWTPSLYAGAMYDSNVNFGIARDIIDIGGVPFRVLDNSRETSDGAAVIDAGIQHVYNPGRRFDSGEKTGFFLWQSQASAYYRAYFDAGDFNLGVATLRTGPSWFVPGKWRAGIGLQADQVWLGDRALALFSTLNPSVTWEFDNGLELSAEGIVAYRDYARDVDRGRDGWYRSGGLRLGRELGDGRWALQAGIAYFDFDADDDRFAHRGPDLFAGAVWNAWRGGSLYLRAGYRRFDFRGEEPGFAKARDDDEYRLIAGLRHAFRDGALRDWSLLADWTWTDNQANIALYEYDRHQFSLGLARNF